MTVSDNALAAAVARGIVTAEQADALRDIEADLARAWRAPADDERLRFITGFGDVFVTIGLALFLGAASYFISHLGPTAVSVGMAVLAWALAEYFTRVRRMALPSIVLLSVFAWVSFFGIEQLIGRPSAPAAGTRPFAELNQSWPVAIAGIGTALLVALHYWRFRLPITVAAGVGALAAAAIALTYTLLADYAIGWTYLVVIAIGLVIFALAMRFDMSDRERVSRRADIAFWLHLLAAPIIVHPLVASMLGPAAQAPSRGAAIGILMVFLALGLVAVLIDRRAFLVSGLAYAGYAFASLLRETGISDQTAPVTVLVLGAFVLALSAGWHPLRAALLAVLPPALRDWLPVEVPPAAVASRPG